VVATLFVAGQEVVGETASRADGVVRRILALDEGVVELRLAELLARFECRHRNISTVLSQNADRIGDRLSGSEELSDARWLLLGAAFTHEYSFEAASICNPSVVPHPDQRSAPLGGLRFVMSVRGMGEGHRSSIGFRTGTLSAQGHLSIDAPGPYPVQGMVHAGVYEKEVFHGRLSAAGLDGETAASVLAPLGEHFTIEELGTRLTLLAEQSDTRRDAELIGSLLRTIAHCSYSVHFDPDTDLSERVLFPEMAAESQGLEDARFVQMRCDDGSSTYLASYTAFDGAGISQQLLRTNDFRRFSASPVVGPAATNKGLALFPRQIEGRYVALSRADGETNSVAFSETLGVWGDAVTIQSPRRDWEVVQLGNCGSPIETEAGWLVLTHGVGPMRTYSIGAELLDLEDPTRLIATLDEPLLSPSAVEQDGYVPNVVYSCGGLLHDGTLVLPYGVADSSISIATVSWPALHAAMTQLC
jgi:predicted GH43/DUF377 family glycosyl hydrolase